MFTPVSSISATVGYSNSKLSQNLLEIHSSPFDLGQHVPTSSRQGKEEKQCNDLCFWPFINFFKAILTSVHGTFEAVFSLSYQTANLFCIRRKTSISWMTLWLLLMLMSLDTWCRTASWDCCAVRPASCARTMFVSWHRLMLCWSWKMAESSKLVSHGQSAII